MTRTMGDATGPSSGSLPSGLDLYAGYVTGTAAVIWTPADWARFPAAQRVTIDQGFTGAPRHDANVIDVETGAWPPSAVGGWMDQATAPRPMVYCNKSNLVAAVTSALTSPRYKGDVWLAFPGWQPGQPLPPLPPGCRYVAVQNNYDHPAYDLSAVLDPTWPLEDPMITIPGVPGSWSSQPERLIDSKTGVAYYVGNGSDGTVWMTKFVSGAWTAPVQL